MTNLLGAKSQVAALESSRNFRLEQARYISSQGVSLMTLAELQDYQDRELVLQACHYFMDAIQFKRDFVEPYLHLARAFIVFHDDRQAVKYLIQAKEFEPEHPDILRLLDFLQSTGKSSRGNTDPPDLPPPIGLAFQQSLEVQDFESLEIQLLKDIRTLMTSEQTQVRLSLNPQIQQEMQAAYLSLKDQYEQIQARLNVLAQETEVSGLELSLRPLEILMRRFQATLQLAGQLTEIKNQIEGLQSETQMHIQALKTEAAQAESQEEALECMLDNCDALADQLDELASANQDISLVEHDYQELVAQIVHWQDMLDC